MDVTQTRYPIDMPPFRQEAADAQRRTMRLSFERHVRRAYERYVMSGPSPSTGVILSFADWLQSECPTSYAMPQAGDANPTPKHPLRQCDRLAADLTTTIAMVFKMFDGSTNLLFQACYAEPRRIAENTLQEFCSELCGGRVSLSELAGAASSSLSDRNSGMASDP